ncbi:MAG TPA: transcription elongation factor GreA [Thermomicrobiales bacterium]|jgi:transcription elongation factor GreA|nr:transcription elongation factor GreA [Chloroflexota bacterium]HCG30583.1 transcription elongation factor GreA [Chloroflexota bacterium]HQZ90225.1 transcription elongation factor GreA [Thermomicrobiales bacterium]HRA31364.1 transcription elongation factor GreA [Thermomicrobiales bacterium]
MATDERAKLTPAGKVDLEGERDLLRSVKRPQLLARIQELSADGDVSDNSEYEDVKEELVQLDSRIREIDQFLATAEIVERAGAPGAVGFGSIVTLVDDEGVEETWTIVGPQETNPRQGRISDVSPVGAALLGKHAGDSVIVSAPGGQTVYLIKSVQ